MIRAVLKGVWYWLLVVLILVAVGAGSLIAVTALFTYPLQTIVVAPIVWLLCLSIKSQIDEHRRGGPHDQ